MDRTSLTVAITLFVCLRVSTNGEQCPYKECTCTGANVACEDLDLSTVPPLLSTNLSGPFVLVFENTQITTIEAGSLPPHLMNLELSNNPITTIDNSAFIESAATLQTMTFSSVAFSRIPDALLQITNLASLAVLDSTITDWNDNVMKHLGTTLLVLELDNINLKTWPEWIHYLVHLTDLKVVNNFINDIPNDAFDTIASSLNSLALYNNYLVSIPEAFKSLSSLQMLYLNDNQITDVRNLAQIQGPLFSLTLSNNKISAANILSQSLRPFELTLFGIEINHNELTAIPDLSFLEGITNLDLSYNNIFSASQLSLPPTLTSLDLDSNNLRSLPYNMSSLSHVTNLILNTNFITEINGIDFPPQVISIILAYNLITEITDTSFPDNSNIEELNINDNPLSKISPLAFKNLPHLNLLQMRNTKLTRLPISLALATNLDNFDISGTFGLVCTCEEKSLGSVIGTMNSDNVKGDCGLTSVYDFFVTLSHFCP
ncbi:unnamed protein product [Candidula unifasciata]|uniref:LRRNT domain-containing protein n=1 Tax=Candidula unifasciata TaxID=100452 RepID=A0A8S3ZAB3_9EUPU|nr:unnamed protein product [Candidula unifasciata]